MNRLRELWRETFGMWWWIMFEDGSCMGPMNYERAHRWAYDSPLPYSVQWSREIPCGVLEANVIK